MKRDSLHDTAALIAEYRRVIAQRDAATLAVDRSNYEGVARMMRRKWKDRTGADTLHELAFGESAEV